MDIGLHTTDELIAELTNRFDDIVIAGKTSCHDSSGDKTFIWRWKGDHHSCMGMVSQMSHRIDEHYMETKRDVA